MDTDTITLSQNLGISLALGMLVGMQRERSGAPLAGVRTFGVVSVLGTLTTFVAVQLAAPWIVAAAFLGLALLVAVAHGATAQSPEADHGLTTELALLLVFAVGAELAVGPRVIGISIGAGAAVLLQLKPELHGLAARIGDKDARAIMQFVLVAFVILPVMPDRIAWLPERSPWDALSPHDVWWMVVLIVGIGLAGYLLYKAFGARAGTLAGGLLGGLISSTATTVSMARRSRDQAGHVWTAALVIAMATCVVYLRMFIEIAAVEFGAVGLRASPPVGPAPSFLLTAALPLGVLALASVVPAAVLALGLRNQRETLPEPSNPTELGSALVFGGLYALITLALAAAQTYAPQGGPMAVAALSGLADLDAITLSTTRMVLSQQVEPGEGWRMLVAAALSNLAFKAALAGLLGRFRLFWRVLLAFAVPVAAGAGLLLG